VLTRPDVVRHEGPMRVAYLPIGPFPCPWLSHAKTTRPDKTPPPHTAVTRLPGPGAVPVRLGAGLALCPGFPLRASIAVCLTFMACSRREPWGLPEVSDASLPACHGLRTPADLHALAETDASCSLRAR
jgi:hypothetical protein